jgi:hypothetical protein
MEDPALGVCRQNKYAKIITKTPAPHAVGENLGRGPAYSPPIGQAAAEPWCLSHRNLASFLVDNVHPVL